MQLDTHSHTLAQPRGMPAGATLDALDAVPHGFSPGELWPLPRRMARRKLGLPQQKFVLLQLGRMVPGKGIEVGLRSLLLLHARAGVDALLLVVGGGPSEQPECPDLTRLRALAEQLDLAQHVRFCGRVGRAQLRYYYGAADVFVSVPQYEPFGITVVEAMACARPVIGAAAGKMGAIVLDGETGFLTPPRDPEALCRRLRLLHAAPDLARAMGEAGMRRAWQRFTWRAIAQRIAGAAPTALAAHPGGAQP